MISLTIAPSNGNSAFKRGLFPLVYVTQNRPVLTCARKYNLLHCVAWPIPYQGSKLVSHALSYARLSVKKKEISKKGRINSRTIPLRSITQKKEAQLGFRSFFSSFLTFAVVSNYPVYEDVTPSRVPSIRMTQPLRFG